MQNRVWLTEETIARAAGNFQLKREGNLQRPAYKNQRRWCLLDVKWNLHFGRGGVVVVLVLVIALGLAGLRHNQRARAGEQKTANDNPDKFYLWASNTSVRHEFTYDPHAADVWLFESAGGTFGKSNVPPTGRANSTNTNHLGR